MPFSILNKEFASESHAKEWMILNQFGRRNLINYQRSVLALEIESVYSERAKEKQREAGGAVPQTSAKAPIDTRKEVAKVANVSHDTIAKVKKIQSTATQEVKDKLESGEVSINQAYKDIKKVEARVERVNKIVEISQGNQTLEGIGKFADVVLPTVLQFRNQGDTLPVIADKLNNMGVKTRRGGKWYASTVTNILKRA